MSKAFGEENPTLGEDPVSWQTFSDGAAGIPDVVGDVDWGKLKLDLLGEEGRSAVYDLGAAATRKFTITENRYGTGAESATIQIRGDTSSFLQDDVLPAWETYTVPVSKGYRYVQVRATTVAQGWWLSGGIASANCIAAYQPKGADDLADSYINVANPGTYDAAPGTAPTWDATNGWKFDAASSQYLTTGIVPADDQTWSAIIKFTDSGTNNNCALFGYAHTTNDGCMDIEPKMGFVNHAYSNGIVDGSSVSGVITAGTLAVAGNKAYKDGVDEGVTLTSVVGANSTPLYIGCMNAYGVAGRFCSSYIQAFAIYDVVLTEVQVQAIGTAMGLL